MNQKKHKTEDLGNWKPFVEQLHKEWEKVKSEQVDENLELKEKTWKRVDRKIFSPRRYILQPLDAVVAPFIEFSFFLYVHHVLVRTRQDHPNDTDLVVCDFPSDACCVQSVRNRFIPAVNAIGVFDKHPVQMCPCRVCIFRYYLSLYMVGLRGVRCTLCFLNVQ